MIDKIRQLRKSIEIEPCVKIEREYDDITLKDGIYKEDLINYINTVRNYVDDKYLNLMYNNFNSLIIYPKYNEVNAGHLGCYYPHNNTIDIIDNKLEILFHEASHAASSCFINFDYCLSGFKQVVNNTIIGEGLNEYYTRILAARFVGSDGIGNLINYDIVHLRILEYLIGEKKMMQYYFMADLKGLANELAKYCDIKDVYYYINSLDYNYKYLSKTKKDDKRAKYIYETYLENINVYYTYKIITQILSNKYIEKDVHLLSKHLNEVKMHVPKAYKLGELAGSIKVKTRKK